MIIRNESPLRWSDVTPRHEYLNRRRFLASALLLGPASAWGAAKLAPVKPSSFSTTEAKTPFEAATTYNNYYEFGTSKDQPAKLAHTLRTSPWTVTVEGAVAKPKVFDLDAIRSMAPLEERIYRMRCVEGWSMVIPWIGFPLNELIKRVEPTSNAKFIAFESLYDTKQMPAANYAGIPLPYKEGLRMDEAMQPLTLLTLGLYGETLPNQNGAPVRIVVPWKYGFKSAKSIVKIRFVEQQPRTAWSKAIPSEYGFYSNVNPEVDHPRWSQATERRLGEFGKRKTLKFNGYGDQVASLYAGMDLKKYY